MAGTATPGMVAAIFEIPMSTPGNKWQSKIEGIAFLISFKSQTTCIVVGNVGVVGEDSSKHGSVEPGAHDHESHHSRLVAARETDANEADARND